MDVTANVTRDGHWWAIEIPDVDGALSQARTLDDVPAMAADAVSVLTGVPADQVHVTVSQTGI